MNDGNGSYQREDERYFLMKNERYTLVYGGQLNQQLQFSAYTCIEENRLIWVTFYQIILKTELYNGLKNVIIKGDTTQTSTLQDSDCIYSKLITVTFFFSFIIYQYEYN